MTKNVIKTLKMRSTKNAQLLPTHGAITNVQSLGNKITTILDSFVEKHLDMMVPH